MTTVLFAVLAMAVAVPVGVLVLRRPQRGVLLLAALLPFHGLLLIIPHPGFVDGWKEGLVLAILAATFIAPAAARGADDRTLPSWLLPVVGWFLLALASAAVIGGEQAQQGMKIGFFYLLLFWAIWRCPLDRRERDHLVTVLMATGLVTALWGIIQQVIGDDALIAMGYQYDTTVRTTGSLMRAFSTFEQPFPFGLFLMVVLLVGLAAALADPRRTRNAAFLVLTPVLLGGLLSSTVRSAVLGLAVGVVVLALLRHRGLLHVIPFAVVGIALVPARILDAFLASGSLDARTSGWDAMAETMLAAPWGVGVGSTGSAAEKTVLEGGSRSGTLATAKWATGYQPDNYYVKVLLEQGPLGLWMVVLLLVATLVAAVKLARALDRAGDRRESSAADAGTARGIAAAIAAAMAASTVATYFEIFPLDAYFWLLLGVLATLPAGMAGSAEPVPHAAAGRAIEEPADDRVGAVAAVARGGS